MTVPGYRVYVAATPEAVRAIHKNTKTMEFSNIQKIAMRQLFLYPEKAIDTLGVHLNGDGTLKLINVPGPELDEVNAKSQKELAKLMVGFGQQGPSPVGLVAILRRTLTLAIIAALWGKDYPLLHDHSLEEDFWTWVEHFWSLLMLPVPNVTSRKGHLARARILNALLEYTKTGGHQLASKVVSAEYFLYKDLGLSEDVIARAGLVSLFVVLSNTVMAGLWLVLHIYSQPSLLAVIRAEVEACITVYEANPNQRTINTTKLKTDCPVLLSTFRETLRLYMDFSLNRFVADDTTIRLPSSNQTFFLRKGSIVQIASTVLQKQRCIWGADADSFNACRFAPRHSGREGSDGTATADTKPKLYGPGLRTTVPDLARPAHADKDQRAAFTVFGGGAHFCPGRHFALHVTAAFVGVLVAGFDIRAADGGVVAPPKPDDSLGHGIKLPSAEVEAVIGKRPGREEVVWAFDG